MKKLVVLSMMAVMILFASCDKDGMYNPLKKISKITYTNTYIGANEAVSFTREQTWTWDKNQLQKIVYYDSEDQYTWTEEFSYNKNGRLVRVEDKENATYTTYEYEGDRLDKVICYEENFREYEYHFKYEGDRVSEIEYWEFADYYSIKKENYSNPLAFVCSPEIATLTQKVVDNIAEAAENQPRHKMDVDITTISLEWDGDNVSRMIYTYPLYNERYEYLLTYDNKLNPFAGFFALDFEGAYDYDYVYKNANNIVSMTSVGDTWKREYTYTYKGRYPESYTYTEVYVNRSYRTDCKIEYK